MKKVLLAVMCLALLLTIGVRANNIDGVYQFHRTVTAPVIDGLMEDLWKTASTELVVKVCVDDTAPPDSYADMFATCRALWDETNVYLFLSATDDNVLIDLTNRYENDSFEVYFNGDQSTSTTYDGWDDIQIRIQYEDTEITDFTARADNVFDPTGSAIAIENWAYPELPEGESPMGWDLEVQIPLAQLGIEGEAGSTFGFEVQLNENDGAGARENMLRWWGTSNDGWANPQVFGVAELSGFIALPVLRIGKVDTAPTIDGSADDWTAPQIHMSTYVYTEGTTAPSGFLELTDWKDLEMNFRAAWDDDNFYVFVEVIDDVPYMNPTSGEPWNMDGVELCIDGDNSKDASSGANDVQWRWCLGGTSTAENCYGGTYAWAQTDSTWTFECAIPADSLTFVLEADAEIGFEVQVNDNDEVVENSRENMARWWGEDNLAWNTPSQWGSAVLVEDIYTYGIDSKDVVKANRFKLSQNFPNPFNPSTSIDYSIEKTGAVKLTVFDMLGHEVATLVNEVKVPGAYKATFDGTGLTSGIYFYQLQAGTNISTNKMMLLK